MDHLIKKFTWKKKLKEIKAKRRELERLQELDSKLGYEELDKPLRDGYRRIFTLRDDISRRRDAHTYWKILPLIQSPAYSKTRSFKGQCLCGSCHKKFKNWRHFKKELRRRNFTCKQSISYIAARDFKDKVPEEFKKFFVTHKALVKRFWGLPQWITTYHFKYPYYFTPVVKPAYITHRKIIDPELKSKIDKLYDNIWNNYDNLRLLAKAESWSLGYRHWDGDESRYDVMEKDFKKEMKKVE